MTSKIEEVITNDKLQNAVAAMVNKSIAAFEAGADFLSEQIPDVLHQLLMWHAAYSAVQCVVALLVAVLLVVIDVKLFKVTREYEKTQTYDRGFATFAGYVLAASAIRVPAWALVFSYLNLTWLQIWIAPKVWLIEYAAKLVK